MHQNTPHAALLTFVQMVAKLRSPEGCPWDRAQTHQSLKQFAIEEAYELSEAIDNKDDEELKKELGDVLFQVVIHSQLARERGAFTIEDVIQSIIDKVNFRHPHVFDPNHPKDLSLAEIESLWIERKKLEKAQSSRSSTLDDSSSLPNLNGSASSSTIHESLSSPTLNESSRMQVNKTFPALLQAEKIGKKSRQTGFDWPDIDGVFAKIQEEILELKEAIASGSKNSIEDEMGDVLFSVTQLSRQLDLNAESALLRSNHKFLSRYHKMLDLCDQRKIVFTQLSDNEKETLWSEAKQKL